MSKAPISVHILTRNSGATLERALQSVEDYAEICILDGGSTDATLSIAKTYNATIVEQQHRGPITHFGNVRNEILNKATQPWILALDSDEYLSKELQEELRTIASTQPPGAYSIPRIYTQDDNTRIDYATTYPNRRFYFFHRDSAKQWIKPVHERMEFHDGTPMLHCTHPCLAPLPTPEEYRTKNKRYLRIEQEKSRNTGWAHWLIHRVLHTLRSRCIGLVRLLWIWCIPRKGKRMPMKLEMLRFWYGWKLIVETCPLRVHSHQ